MLKLFCCPLRDGLYRPRSALQSKLPEVCKSQCTQPSKAHMKSMGPSRFANMQPESTNPWPLAFSATLGLKFCSHCRESTSSKAVHGSQSPP